MKPDRRAWETETQTLVLSLLADTFLWPDPAFMYSVYDSHPFQEQTEVKQDGEWILGQKG